MEKLIYFFDKELFSQIKSESLRPLSLPRYDSLQISFLKENGGISKKKQLKPQENLEEGEEK